MKKGILFPIIIFISLAAACNLSTFQSADKSSSTTSSSNSKQTDTAPIMKETETPQPTIAVILPTKIVTQISSPTEMPTNTQALTENATEPAAPETSTSEPAQTCAKFGVEEFDQPTSCWPSTLEEMKSITSLTNSASEFAGIKDGRLEFKHTVADEIYLYSFNNSNTYDQVVIEATFIKIDPSFNQNGATIACHVNDSGWYEVRLESSGTFAIFHYDAAEKLKGANPYISITQGGAPGVQSAAGKENTIRWTCKEDSLSLAVNGKDVWNKEFSSLQSGGGIGLGLVSFSGKFPLDIAFERVEISEP